jgi:hypothetical protein
MEVLNCKQSFKSRILVYYAAWFKQECNWRRHKFTLEMTIDEDCKTVLIKRPSAGGEPGYLTEHYKFNRLNAAP